MIRKPALAWKVSLPQIQTDTVNFVFTTSLPIGLFGFKFMWFNSVWNIWVTLPSGEIRQAGGHSNEVSWTGFLDYYFQLVTTLDNIGQNDLGNVTLMVYQQ